MSELASEPAPNIRQFAHSLIRSFDLAQRYNVGEQGCKELLSLLNSYHSTETKLSIDMQVPIRKIIEGLGGDQFVKRPIRHEFDLIEIVKEGLPIGSVAFLQKNFGFTNKEMSHILAISESTYQRRIRSKSKLTQDETEKAISLSELYVKGIDVFRNQTDFETWLQTKIPAMGNHRPTDMLSSMIGRQHVIDALNRILHGIFS